tara:strand:- start:63 stop:1595 length:1533 start_codon:yes stop_codon:yes gene_type:complete
MSQGLPLPPSLVESDSGDFGIGLETLPVSWNSLHHDQSLLNIESQPSLIVIIDAPQLSSNRGMLERALLTVRTRFPASLIWAPGISGPDNCALLAWMGVDMFDLARSRKASALGVLLTEGGPRKTEPSTGEESSMQAQCDSWVRSISATRSAIRDGSLREMAERQSTSSPRSVEHLRLHDQISYEFSKQVGITIGHADPRHQLRCHSYVSRNDSQILEWRDRVSNFHEPPSHQRDALLLLPCSAKKPYKLSQSHSRFRRYIGTPKAHEVMVTSPLGLVPREIEELWPAAHYDIPVTGEWDLDEIGVIRDMVNRIVERVGYSTVINHSGVDVSPPGASVIDTRLGETAGSQGSLNRLQDAIESTFAQNSEREHTPNFRIEVLKSISKFQFGSDEWLERCEVRGRPPILTIYKEGMQMAKWDPRRGRFSFSKHSLETLEELSVLKRVELLGDSDWVGDIFPSNLLSHDTSIKSGDEVLVFQNGSLVGSARAIAPGWEWPHGPGRLAKSRHRI